MKKVLKGVCLVLNLSTADFQRNKRSFQKKLGFDASMIYRGGQRTGIKGRVIAVGDNTSDSKPVIEAAVSLRI